MLKKEEVVGGFLQELTHRCPLILKPTTRISELEPNYIPLEEDELRFDWVEYVYGLVVEFGFALRDFGIKRHEVLRPRNENGTRVLRKRVYVPARGVHY